MREIGFSEHWKKLNQGEFTTFRLPRKDKDWSVGEVVRVVYRPRSKQRQILCHATIITKHHIADIRNQITDAEAVADGFPAFGGTGGMLEWMLKAHDIRRLVLEGLNKLTLQKKTMF